MKEQMKLLLEQNKLLVQKLSVPETEPTRPHRKSKAQKEQERKEHQKNLCFTVTRADIKKTTTLPIVLYHGKQQIIRKRQL